MKRTVFALACVLAAAVPVAAADLALAVRGQPAAYTIVTPVRASACENYAAEELQRFVEQVAGVKLARTTDANPLPAHAILVGETKHSRELLQDATFDPKSLGEDGFRLAARPPHLVVYGSAKRGALYGVYELLETYAGCKWYASWHSVIPTKERVSVPDTLDDTQKPALLMRQPFWYDYNTHRDFAARLRVNGYNHTADDVDAKFGGDSFRFGGGLGSCHTFNVLVPPEEFFDSHPEYFSLIKGKRLKHPSQLCLTNPEVLDLVVARVLARIRQDPGAKFYGVSQNDWYNYCECEACAAIDAEEESHAGTMVRFINAVAERVEKEFPDAVIETLAYQYTRKPPKKTRLRHNVVPCLCTIECDFARAIPESPFASNIAFRDDIAGWKTQTDQLYVWDYTTDFGHYTLPFPNVLALQGNIKFFRDNNVKELFEQGAYQGRHGDFAELKGWLLAKLMWNPDQPLEPLLADFFNGYYGRGAPFVRAYFDELHARQLAWSADPKQPLRIFDGVNNKALPDDFLVKAAGLWDQAIAATKDDSATSYNVRMGAFAVDYARFMRAQAKRDLVLWADSSEPPADASGEAEKRRLAQSLLARFDEAKDIRLAESAGESNRRVQSWRDLLAAPPAPPLRAQPEGGVLEEKVLQLARPGRWGAFVDDPAASDGRALKLFNSHFEWCTTFPLARIHFAPGHTYRIRVRLRVETASEGEAFWAGVYNYSEAKGRGGIEPKTSQTPSTYTWYDVCTLEPREGDTFWIGPGRFNADGKSPIKAVYIDQIDVRPAE